MERQRTEDLVSPDGIRRNSSLMIKFSSFISEKKGSFSDDYKLGGLLGSGCFGYVRKVTHRKTKEVRAMKIIEKKNVTRTEDSEKLVADIQILKQLDHPNILKLYEFYQDEKAFYIIYEYCAGGELFDKIIELGCFGEHEASYIMKQVLSAVVYAHNHKIVHRDLKPENILLDIAADGSYIIKVIDWGTAREYDSKNKMKERYGTAYYMAPEVIKKSYDAKCDIWSCGVILYVMLSGRPPFVGRSEADIMANIIRGTYSLEGETWSLISDEAKNLLTRMLEYDPRKRLSARDALEHPWFVNSAGARNGYSKDVLKSSLANLKSFRAEQKLQQAAVTFIASHLISKEEKQQLINVFKDLDKNGDGVLSREEILEGYKKIMTESEAIAEADRIMEQVDIDKSGFIDYTEFIAATIDRKKLVSKEKLEASFRLFDKDGSGTISPQEIKEVLGTAIQDLDEEVWQEIIKEVDVNGDGEISFEEFSNMIMKYLS